MLRIHKEPFIQNITEDWMLDTGLQLFIKREDVIHPYVSGNKWRKLKYNLEEAKQQGFSKLLTFGGAFSNHIYATAAAAKEAGLVSVGIIRGEELARKPLNKTLTFSHEQGMRLHFVSRADYREKTALSFLNILKEQFGDFYLIPEGGTNPLAIKGTTEILNDDTKVYDYITASVGTGGTIAGIITAAEPHQQVVGFSALKGDFLFAEVNRLITENDGLWGHKSWKATDANWHLKTNYHCGGYAKTPDYLMAFIEAFEKKHQVLLDPIYTGKMMYGIYDLIESGYFKRGSQILAIHTGGLQGRKVKIV